MGLDMASAGNFIQKTLPWIGAAVSGNVPALIGLAASAIGSATGKDIDPTAQAITNSIATASPDEILKMKAAEEDFKLKAQSLGFQHEEELRKLSVQEKQIDAEDYADARKNNAANRAYWVLAYIILGSFAVVMGFVLWGCYLLSVIDPTKINTALIAAIAGLVGTIVGYFGANSQTVINSIYGGLLQRNGDGIGKALGSAITQLGQSSPAVK